MQRTTALLFFCTALLGSPVAAHAADDGAALREPPSPSSSERRATVVDAGPSRLLLATGAATFAFSYGGAAWVGLTSTRSADRPLLVPFAGPWIALHAHVTAACDQLGGPCGQETAYSGLLIADGLVQAASAVQIALAFVHRELHETSEPVMRTAHVSVAPARAPGGGLALAAVGEF